MAKHAVAAEKDGRAPSLAWNLVLRAGKRVGNPDIDEVIPERGRQELFGAGKRREGVFLERAAAIEPVDQGISKHIDAAADQPVSGAVRAVAEPDNSTIVDLHHPIARSIGQRPD